MLFSDKKQLALILAALLVTTFEILSLTGVRIEGWPGFLIYFTFVIGFGYETLYHGIKALFKAQFQSINLLMTIAVAGAFWLGQFEEAAVVIVLFALAERLEVVGVKTAKSSLDRLLTGMPKTATLKGRSDPIPLDQIQLDQVILVKPHELIPLDGEVVNGTSFVDESSITGEPIPADKRVGDPVFAGTLNSSGALEVRVTSDQAHSTLAKIQELTFSALEHKALTQTFIERFSSFYTPFVIALALIWVVATGSIEEAITLLVISCPCALVISTPVAIFASLGKANSMGVLIKGGRYIEVLGQMKTLAFDKTRTLTFGQPIVTDIVPFNGSTKESVLSSAAGVELFSEHPLGQGIVKAASQQDLTPHETVNFESVSGKGARAECLVCTHKKHSIGKLEFILEEHTVPKEVVNTIHELQAEAKTVVVLSNPKEIEGVIALQDALRPDAKETLDSLNKMGITSIILTGDHERSATALAKQLGISTKSELLPQQKASEVESLKSKGVVGMIGDGVNDAPALATADVGISMSSLGSDTALEAANIVILNNHLKLLPTLVQLGRRTLRMIRFNTAFAIGTKALVIALALQGVAGLALAIFADVGVTLLVILNSLRLKS